MRENSHPTILTRFIFNGNRRIESCDISEDLERLCETIIKFALQEPTAFHTEEVKVEYLYNATPGYNWGRISLTKCNFQEQPWNCHQLFTALGTSRLREKKMSAASTLPVPDPSIVLREKRRTCPSKKPWTVMVKV